MKTDRSEALEKLRGEVDFFPLVPGGSGFCTHRLNFSNPDRIKVTTSIGGILFPLVFILMGGGTLALGIFGDAWPFCIFGGVFLALGVIVLVLFWRKRAVFELYSGMFVRGRLTVPMSRIAALQTVAEECRSKNSTYLSWELNLVLEDGTRVNVFDHGNFKKFNEDALRLAGVLKVPIWSMEEDAEADADGESAGPDKGEIKPGTPGARKKNSPVLFIIMGAAFLILPSFLLFTGLLHPLYMVHASADWESCPAVVTKSGLIRSRSSKGSVSYRIDIEAEYVRGRRMYLCRRYDFFRSSFSSNLGVAQMNEIVNRHPVGAEIECLADPENPANSVISREVPMLQVLFVGGFAAVFLIAGCCMLIAGVRQAGKKSPPSPR